MASQTNHSVDEGATHCVGPYMLERTLGKGQTGLVKLGVHCITKKTAAVKIVNRAKLSKSVLLKVEREIAIMKLVDHPHVLGLHDVYENNTYLYLVLEHVSGGELFDYLVKRGRLMEKEAKKFFSQIISAVNFCHKHSICHRDLKPENLLLDEHKNIKVADFGMASLQVRDHMLETSCGSPHYACPEVIRGDQYDGRKADVWSCGVILFALLVGALPFDDDNLRVLLEKVKRGDFKIPSFVPSPAQELIRGMVQVNPAARLTMDDVLKHPWMHSLGGSDLESVPRMEQIVQTVPLYSRSEIDPDIFKSMASLGCFKDKQALIKSLMSEETTEEKVIYFLLLMRKAKQPSLEDEQKAPAFLGDELHDPPRKRLDSKVNMSQPVLERVRSHSVGSPFSSSLQELPSSNSPRSTLQSPAKSPHGYYSYSPTVPRSQRTSAPTLPLGSTPPGSPWKRRISTIRSLVGSPRFHRRKLDDNHSPEIPEIAEPPPPSPVSRSPPNIKKSWFANLITSNDDKEELIVIYEDKSFIELKASVMGACAACNIQCTEIGDTSFKLKYDSKTKGKVVFKKTVKLIVSIDPANTPTSNGHRHRSPIETYTLTFSHTAGSPRRFKKLCERIQVAILKPYLLMEATHRTKTTLSDEGLSLHSNGDANRGTPTHILIANETSSKTSSLGSNHLLADSSDNESDDDLLNE